MSSIYQRQKLIINFGFKQIDCLISNPVACRMPTCTKIGEHMSPRASLDEYSPGLGNKEMFYNVSELFTQQVYSTVN